MPMQLSTQVVRRGQKWSRVAEESGQTGGTASVDAPRGVLSARVDEKGRLKLPSAIVQYLDGFGERKVFVTTLNVKTARIYPISVWKRAEASLEESGEDSDVRDDIAFVANHYGADDEIDGQGRVLVPTELRRTLKLENEQVYLRCAKQRVEVIGREMYESRLAKAVEGADEKLLSLEKKGLR
jgi:MraZ protein